MAIRNDCFFREGRKCAVLGNSRIEIRLDRITGAVTSLRNKIAGVEYLGKGTPEVFRIEHCTWAIHGAPSKDLWGAVNGTLISSSNQKVTAMHFERTTDGARLEVIYDCLRLERRTIPVAVKYTVELKAGDEETRWKISIQNHDEGTIREVHFPFISGLRPFDALIMPNHGGQKLSQPVDKLSDETPQIYLEYPARASMQWFEYYSAQAGLYMASYDQDLGYTRLYFGRLEARRDVAMWIVKYPFAASETCWESPILALGIHAGNWHWGADRYRSWLESWLVKPDVPRHIKEMIGGGEAIWIKGYLEELISTYEDIARIEERSRSLKDPGSHMAVGWFYNGHDTFYPEYFPIDDLGGEKALVNAIDKAHQSGALINAYVNARLACIDTETYKKHGKKWSVLTRAPGLGVSFIEFGELHEEWNREWERDTRSEGWFAVMCPFVKEWQDHLVGECVRVIRDYHFDGLFLDQPGSYWAELCYNKNHGHSTPATAWGPGYLELLRRVRQATRQVNPQSTLWIEGMNDAYGQYLDYHMDKNPTWGPMKIHPQMETFVEMWRYTVPDYVTMNFPLSYSYPPAQDPVYGDNYHFVLGVRGVGAREAPEEVQVLQGQVAEEPRQNKEKHKAVVSKIERLWRKGGKYLFYGRFMDDIGLKVSRPDVLAKVYSSDDGIAIPMWNTSDQELAVDLSIDPGRLGWSEERLAGAVSLETDESLPQQSQGCTIHVKISLPPHDIDAIILAALP